MALYRFLFAPALLVVAALLGGRDRPLPQRPRAPAPPAAAAEAASVAPAPPDRASAHATR